MSNNQELAGVLPVVQTPFLDSEDIDEGALVKELHWILDQGVSGFTTGMVSEILRLTETERQQLTEIVVGVALERGVLSVISCGAESTKTAISHARHAERCGATAVMAVPPLTVAIGDDALYGYYSEIADSTTISLVVQDSSSYVGRPLSIALQLKLLEVYGNRLYFKPEATPIGQRVSLLLDATGGDARIFDGMGGVSLVDNFRRGLVGTMPGAEVCWAIQKMWAALKNNDWTWAYEMSGPLSSLIDLQTSIDGFVSVEKYLLRRQGVIGSVLARGPFGYVLDIGSRDEVDRLFERLRYAARMS